MNEYIEVRLFKSSKRLRVKRQVPGGIELDETDPIERTVGIGFAARSEATRVRMDNIRRIQGWPPGQFDLKKSVEDGSIILRGVNEHTLPEGFYKLRLEIEEAKTGGWQRVNLDHDTHAVVDVDITMDDRTVDVDLAACDQDIQDVLDRSQIDGADAPVWLEDTSRRPTRQACLLNLLASMRTRPSTAAPLIDLVDRVFWVANDRIYVKVDRQYLETVKALARDADKFYEEGTPHAAVHGLLLAAIPEPPAVKAQFRELCSFRGEGKPSMQTVIAVPPAGLAHTYAELDLDLGNPLQDVLGFFVHVGELLDGKPTNHLDLRKALAKTKAGDFLYYTVKL